jgi:hypothetical protein
MFSLEKRTLFKSFFYLFYRVYQRFRLDLGKKENDYISATFKASSIFQAAWQDQILG